MDEAGLFPALRCTISDLKISLQNVLTFAGTFVIPSVAHALGAPMAVAVGVGLCLPIWFLVLKTINRATSKGKLCALGAFCSVVVVSAGFGLSVYMKPKTAQPTQVPNSADAGQQERRASPELPPAAIKTPVTQTAGPCAANVIGSGNTVANCGSDAKEKQKK
jgi:hypothetical protein